MGEGERRGLEGAGTRGSAGSHPSPALQADAWERACPACLRPGGWGGWETLVPAAWRGLEGAGDVQEPGLTPSPALQADTWERACPAHLRPGRQKGGGDRETHLLHKVIDLTLLVLHFKYCICSRFVFLLQNKICAVCIGICS